MGKSVGSASHWKKRKFDPRAIYTADVTYFDSIFVALRLEQDYDATETDLKISLFPLFEGYWLEYPGYNGTERDHSEERVPDPEHDEDLEKGILIFDLWSLISLQEEKQSLWNVPSLIFDLWSHLLREYIDHQHALHRVPLHVAEDADL